MEATRIDLENIEGSPTKLSEVGNSRKKRQPNPNPIRERGIIQPLLDDYALKSIGNKETLKTQFRGRQVTIEVSKFKIEVTLANSDAPLTTPELDGYLCYLEGLFGPRFYEYNWVFKSFGVSVEYTDLWIEGDGITAITMQDVKGHIKRWYNKRNLDICRRETHRNVPIRLEEIIENLRGKSQLGALECLEREDEIKLSLKKLSDQYSEMIIKLDKLMDIIALKSEGEVLLNFNR